MKNTVQEQARQLIDQVKARATGQVKETAGVPFTPDAKAAGPFSGPAITLVQRSDGCLDIDDLNMALQPYGVHLVPTSSDDDVLAVGPVSMTQEQVDAEFDEFIDGHQEIAADRAPEGDPEAVVPPNDSEAAQQNATKWVMDRVDNDEPLLFNDFVTFMVDMGGDAATYRGLKQQMQADYAKQKANYSPRGHRPLP